MPYIPSAQQQALFDWIKSGTGNAVLEAVAGAGKSTTLLEATARMSGFIFLGAYGKKAAEDLKEKAAEKGLANPNLRIGTMHSVCSGVWRKAAPKAQLVETKVDNIITAMVADARTGMQPNLEFATALETYRSAIKKLVSLGKGFLMGVTGGNPQVDRQRAVTNTMVWVKLGTHYNIWDDLPEDVAPQDVVPLVVAVFEASARMCMDVVDFDDQIYAPLRFNARFFQYDWVLGDEWQDANPARREAVRRMLRRTGRAIFCGDHRQAIFGFTGAGNNSLHLTSTEFCCTELPLTITYRCPQAVVAYVQQWVNHIEAHPDAHQGKVETLVAQFAGEGANKVDVPWFMAQRPAPTDAILCRYNKPLVDTAFAMLRNGIACKVEGRDIGKNLVVLATRWKVKTLDALDKRLDVYLEREVAKAQAANSERKEQDVKDRVDTLRVFIEQCRAKGNHTLDCVVAEITDLFRDNVAGVTTLCSGHKSKGREWGRVFWLQASLRSKRELQAWEKEQEANLCYVMATRVEGQRGAGELFLVPEGVQ